MSSFQFDESIAFITAGAQGIAKALAARGTNLAIVDSLLSPDARAQSEDFLSEGLSPESVGELVVAAMQKNELFIHTHDTVAALVQSRTDEILVGFPV